MDLGQAQQINLKSYPNSQLELPLGAQILTPKDGPTKGIPRELSLAKLRAHLLPLLTQVYGGQSQSDIRVLLLLPDKTRKQTAARLLIDTMIELCQSVQTLSFDIIFGLGTHPVMSDGDIATMIGPQRLERLAARHHPATANNPQTACPTTHHDSTTTPTTRRTSCRPKIKNDLPRPGRIEPFREHQNRSSCGALALRSHYYRRRYGSAPLRGSCWQRWNQ